MIRLLLADDHALVRQGLSQIFRLAGDICVTCEASSGADVLAALRNGQSYDLIVLDMTMPGISGVDLIRRIDTHPEAPPILVLSMHNEPIVARRALSAGAQGYLTKDSQHEVLLAAVRRVASGGRFIDPVLAASMLEEDGETASEPQHLRLSSREQEILRLLVRGSAIQTIADDLKISHKTVSTHTARLLEKLGLNSTAELVRYALTHRLIE